MITVPALTLLSGPSNPVIRLAFLVDCLTYGGTELNAVRLAERLHGPEFKITLGHLQPDGPLLARYRAAGIETSRISHDHNGWAGGPPVGVAFQTIPAAAQTILAELNKRLGH